jgi:hypothetical protein
MMGDLERIIFFIPALYLTFYIAAVIYVRRLFP